MTSAMCRHVPSPPYSWLACPRHALTITDIPTSQPCRSPSVPLTLHMEEQLVVQTFWEEISQRRYRIVSPVPQKWRIVTYLFLSTSEMIRRITDLQMEKKLNLSDERESEWLNCAAYWVTEATPFVSIKWTSLKGGNSIKFQEFTVQCIRIEMKTSSLWFRKTEQGQEKMKWYIFQSDPL